MGGYLVANDIPFTSEELDPLAALTQCLAFSSNDWSSARDFAWIYGIVCGWADEDNDSHSDLAAKFGWSNKQVEHLRRLNYAFRRAHENWTP